MKGFALMDVEDTPMVSLVVDKSVHTLSCLASTCFNTDTHFNNFVMLKFIFHIKTKTITGQNTEITPVKRYDNNLTIIH